MGRNDGGDPFTADYLRVFLVGSAVIGPGRGPTEVRSAVRWSFAPAQGATVGQKPPIRSVLTTFRRSEGCLVRAVDRCGAGPRAGYSSQWRSAGWMSGRRRCSQSRIAQYEVLNAIPGHGIASGANGRISRASGLRRGVPPTTRASNASTTTAASSREYNP